MCFSTKVILHFHLIIVLGACKHETKQTTTTTTTKKNTNYFVCKFLSLFILIIFGHIETVCDRTYDKQNCVEWPCISSVASFVDDVAFKFEICTDNDTDIVKAFNITALYATPSNGFSPC